MSAAPAAALNPTQARYLARVRERISDGTYSLETVPRCPCGHSNSLVIARQDRFGLPVEVVACSRCGLARTSPRLSARNLGRFYNDDYHGLHMGVPNPSASVALYRYGQGRSIYRFVEPYLQSKVMRVGEVGCGTGQVLRELVECAARDGIRVEAVGSDYASAYVEAGRVAGTRIVQGSAQELINEGPFDLVILSHVFEHFPDPLEDMRSVVDLMAAEAIVYVEVPGILTIHTKPEYQYEFLQYLTVAHTYHYSRATLARVLWQVGLEELKSDEHVRMLVRRSQSNAAQPPQPNLESLLAYLDWLERSLALGVRRTLRKRSDASKRRMIGLLRRVMGDDVVAAVRAALKSRGRR